MKNLLKLSMLSLGLVASAYSLAQGACSGSYTIENNWGSGAQVSVSVKNNGAAVTSWQVCWTFNGNETIANGWDGVFTSNGKNVCVSNASYNGNLAANGTAKVGFNINNPSTSVPTAFTLNGVSCGGGSSSSKSSASSSVSSSSSSVATVAARWLLDATNSAFHFVTVKNISNAEAMTFTQLKGTVSTTGAAVLTIPLASISSGVETRNTRMQSMLFESGYLPNLHFTTQLDLSALDALAVGAIQVQTLTGNLILHGVTKSISFDATIVKHSATSISVSPRRPIIINSADYDLNAGVEALRAIANLTAIGEKTPVYFKMFLTRDSTNSVAAITLANAPATPTSFVGNLSLSADATLNWADVSNDESGFSLRRKGSEGRWSTISNLVANTSTYIDSLLLALSDTYIYKLISYKDSVPSAPSSQVTLVYGGGGSTSSTSSTGSNNSSSSVGSNGSTGSTGSNSSGSSSSSGQIIGNAATGAQLWTARGCVGCHGVDGEKNASGTPVFAPLNPNRSVYRHSQDTQDRILRDFIAKWMPQTDPGSCTGQCAADLEAYILTWRRPSDGIPDNPVSTFSCPTTGPTYGQRTLRLLTKNEYQRSVRDLVGYTEDVISRLPDDVISGAFANNNTLQIDKTRYTSYLSTAERIAANVATRWSAVLSCVPTTTGCADKLVTDLAPRIFRRPLTAEEKTAYLAVAQGTADGRTAAAGMEVALTAMLSSPQFLYRSELGDAANGVYKLNGYEMATYMSYTFTGTTPGASLMSVAASGGLDTPAGIRQQAAILLNSTAPNALLGDFVNKWLGTETLPIKEKTGVTDFAALAGDMKLELGKNFAQAMLNGSSTFASVYNPNKTYVNQRLATLYGLTYNASGADADGFVSTNTTERGGILLSGAFLARYASATDANMVTRAVAIRRKMMCQDIPEPPSGVSLDREALAARDKDFFENPHTTQRMIFERITSGTSCSNCHGEIINPLGASLENYDTLGRVRSSDLKGNAINAAGTFFSPYPQLQFLNDPDRVIYQPAIQFNGGKDLARVVVEDPMVSGLARSCLATQFVSYSTGITSIFLIDSKRDVGYPRISSAEESAYRCGISSLNSVLTSKGPRAMLEEIPALDSVIYRKEWAR